MDWGCEPDGSVKAELSYIPFPLGKGFGKGDKRWSGTAERIGTVRSALTL